MWQNDLGTCVILSRRDISRLNVNLNNLEKIKDDETKDIVGISDRRIRKKLRKEIEYYARKHNADVAIIDSQEDSLGIFTQCVSYFFSLYRYKK